MKREKEETKHERERERERKRERRENNNRLTDRQTDTDRQIHRQTRSGRTTKRKKKIFFLPGWEGERYRSRKKGDNAMCGAIDVREKDSK